MYPVVRNKIHIRVAYQILQQDMDAVLLVDHMLGGRFASVTIAIFIIVIEVYLFA